MANPQLLAALMASPHMGGLAANPNLMSALAPTPAPQAPNAFAPAVVQAVQQQAPTPIIGGPQTNSLAEALIGNATGSQSRTPFEALGKLAELYAGNKRQDQFVAAQASRDEATKQKAAADQQAKFTAFQDAIKGGASPQDAALQTGVGTDEAIKSMFDKNAQPEVRELGNRLVSVTNGVARDITPEGMANAGYRPLTDPAERSKYGIPVTDTRPWQVGPDGKLDMPGGGGVNVNVGANGPAFDNLPVVPLDEKGVPDAAAQTEFFKSLDPATASLVKGIVNYQMDISKVTSLRGDERRKIAELAAQADPTFDMTQYGARAAMRKSITSGTYSQALNSANLVIQHLDALKSAAAELKNSQFQPFNAIANTYKQQTGDPAITKFNTAADAVASEAAKVFKGTGVSDVQTILEWRKNLSANSSPEQINAAISMLAGNLLKSRLDTIQAQFQSAMGHPINFTFLTPHSRQVLQDLGLDATSLDPNVPADQPPTPTPTPTVGAAPPVKAAPAKGTIQDGYRFNGGDPADPKNWERATF